MLGGNAYSDMLGLRLQQPNTAEEHAEGYTPSAIEMCVDMYVDICIDMSSR